ncbi:MAG: TolC family protein [Holosporaceae bacterium]|jgi:outer membrane protein TolC|nr:TolC family protein [Holosporaceae bacterium]
MKNSCLFVSALAFIVCFGADSQEKKTSNTTSTSLSKEKASLTFEEALIAAYNSSKQWAQNRIEKKIADTKLTNAKMMFLPNVSAYAQLSRDRNEIREVSRGGDSTKKTTGTNFGIRVQQNIFNGFSTTNTIKAEQHASNAAFHKLKFEEQKLITDVLEKYTNIWLCRTKVAALRKMEENLLNLLEAHKTMLEAGTVNTSDVSAASANHQTAVYKRIEAETELFSAESEFEKLTGLKVGKNIRLPEMKFDLPKSLDALVDTAMKHNSVILLRKFEEQHAESQLNVTKGRLSPSCNLTLDAGRRLQKTTANDSTNTYSATLEISVPIFANSAQEGNSYSAIEIANQSALKAKFAAEDALLDVKKECVVNWNTYITANAMIQSSRSAVQSAELSTESNIEEANLGLKSNTDIWEKENRLLDSRINLAQSQRTKMITAVKILALTGSLNIDTILNCIQSEKKSAPKAVDKQKKSAPKAVGKQKK